MKDIHFGKMIRNELKRQRYSVSWFSNEMGCTRGNMYKILSHSDLPTSFIIRSSIKLQHDFFSDASALLKEEYGDVFSAD